MDSIPCTDPRFNLTLNSLDRFLLRWFNCSDESLNLIPNFITIATGPTVLVLGLFMLYVAPAFFFYILYVILYISGRLLHVIHYISSRRRGLSQSLLPDHSTPNLVNPPQQIPPRQFPDLPVLAFSDPMKLNGTEAECIICLSEFEIGDEVTVLPKCKHRFHYKCIEKWLLASPLRSSCPTCRSIYRPPGQKAKKREELLV